MNDEHFQVEHSEDEWKKRLSSPAYAVLRGHGTERAFTSPLNQEKRPGTFLCAGCGQALFSSTDKYESGSGWPSFVRSLPGAVGTRPTTATGWSAPRSTARAATGTWATSSTTVPAPPASASA